MNIETSYPIFESGQVLTSAHLNDLVDYLEQQDRLSRRALTGIGVLCGFDVDVAGGLVSLSKGVAVTSEGFLIIADAQDYNRVRSYEVPVPTAEEATADEIAEAQYPFLFPNGGPQIPVFELLDTDFAPAPGEPDPDQLTDAFLADKTVMLFLECQLESLKSCDVNDCSDKGAERRFTLHRLLVTRAQADAMLAQEAAIANRPVDRANHPRLALPYLRIEKLGIAHHKVSSFFGLLFRILTIALKLAGELPQALRDAYAAYDYLLEDLYEDGADPFPPTYFSNVWGQLALNLFMAQYFYDYMRDVAMAYNEFAEAAANYEAECLPNPAQFPKHVLLGDAVDEPDAFTTEFQNAAEVIAFDQGAASAGVGLPIRPAPRRAHFIPAPDPCCDPRRDEVRALFLRLHLLAYTYRTQGLMTAPIRVTPSRTDAAPLSERAIPFHYEFDQSSDIYRNWSPRKTRSNLLNTVYSYRFSPPTDEHPLWFRLDDQDFIRVEGIVGKPLGSVMAQLIGYKKALGLPISIEPVFMNIQVGDADQTGQTLDRQSAAAAAAAARKLLLCRISDQLDVIFLVIIAALFAFLVFLIRRLGGQRTGAQAALGGDFTGGATGDVLTAEATLTGGGATAFLDPATARRFRINLPPEEEAKLRADSDALRLDLSKRAFVRGDVISELNPDAADDSAARVFDAVKDDAAGGNLFDRTRAFVLERGGDDAEVRATYAQVAVLEQSEQLIDALSVETISDFNEAKFSRSYKGFADSIQNYAVVVAEETPSDSPEFRDRAQIAAVADTVASQTSAFAAGNIQTQIVALLGRLFERLTLAGYAKRNPGLEHHAGAPKAGTLVLGFVRRIDLERRADAILSGVGTTIGGLTTQLGTTQAVGLAGAAQELAAASADRTEDPLDEFIVVADFCLPYQCCDADCSDIVLSDRLSADPFADDVDPGPMAVPPVEPPAPTPPTAPPRRDFPIRNRPPIFRGERPPRGLTTPIERFIRPTPDPRPVAEATLAGVVGVVGVAGPRGGVTPVRGAEVVLRDADGSERRVRTEDGAFKFTTPPGEFAIRGAAPGHRGRSEPITLGPGEDREMTLLVTRQG